MPSCVTKSRGRYLFSFCIPERHRAVARAKWPTEFTGATYIRVALDTPDARVAAQRAAPFILRWTERFAELEAGATKWEQARAELDAGSVSASTP
jgi:hypothetical protein